MVQFSSSGVLLALGLKVSSDAVSVEAVAWLAVGSHIRAAVIDLKQSVVWAFRIILSGSCS